MTTWDDPGGKVAASVDEVKNNRHRGNVSARTASRTFYVSRDDQESFHWVSDLGAGVGTTGGIAFSLENDSSTKNLFIEEIVLVSDTISAWGIYRTLVSDTPAGTTITSVNLNANGPDTSDSKAFGNALVTGISNTITSKLDTLRSGANSELKIDYFGGLILGRGDGINVQMAGPTVGSGVVAIGVHGHFE
jgi:hypothetical protein